MENSNQIYYVYFEDEVATRKGFDWVEKYKSENVSYNNIGYYF